MESPQEKQSLVAIARAGESYTISERVEVQHMADRGQRANIVLEVGDVIDVTGNDPQKGLALRTSKSAGTVLISPEQAQSIVVEKIE